MSDEGGIKLDLAISEAISDNQEKLDSTVDYSSTVDLIDEVTEWAVTLLRSC
jgi:hypothetical protein